MTDPQPELTATAFKLSRGGYVAVYLDTNEIHLLDDNLITMTAIPVSGLSDLMRLHMTLQMVVIAERIGPERYLAAETSQQILDLIDEVCPDLALGHPAQRNTPT